MPVDAEPVEDGTVALFYPVPPGGDPTFKVLSGNALELARRSHRVLYRSHFATCPQAQLWRRDALI